MAELRISNPLARVRFPYDAFQKRRMKKRLVLLTALVGVTSLYFTSRFAASRLIDSDWVCLQKAHAIAMRHDKNPNYLSKQEHCLFLNELGHPVTPDTLREGTFSYGVYRGIFLESKISVYFGETRIWDFTRGNLDEYIQGHTR